MKVFLVRHGRTSDFSEKKWQSPNSSLNNDGRKQAKLLAMRLQHHVIGIILSSKLPRAKETSSIIANSLKKPIELFEGIHERELNPKLYGSKWSSKIHGRFHKESVKNFSNLDWRFDGHGESMRDVINRAIKFEKHLISNHLEQDLLIISHEIFIRCFVVICILSKNYTDKAFIKVFRSLSFNSAGISLLQYDEKLEVWKLRYLNDFSHLESV